MYSELKGLNKIMENMLAVIRDLEKVPNNAEDANMQLGIAIGIYQQGQANGKNYAPWFSEFMGEFSKIPQRM